MDRTTENELRARTLVVLYDEFDVEGLSPADALMSIELLAEKVAEENPTRARRIIHELAAEDDAPLRVAMEGRAVEFPGADEDRIDVWVRGYVDQLGYNDLLHE